MNRLSRNPRGPRPLSKL